MAWHITGIDFGPCSCDIGCPCILGEMEGDRGWCSAVRLYDIHSGEVDGMDVSGTKVALVADWPSGFLAGNGTQWISPKPCCLAREKSHYAMWRRCRSSMTIKRIA